MRSHLAPALVLACLVQSPSQAPPAAGTHAPQTQDADAVRLFNGASLDGWDLKNVRRERVTVIDGTLVLDAPSGWLLTHGRYFDFTLRFEAKMSPSSRSGLLLRVLPGQRGAAAYEVPLANGRGAAGGLLWHRAPEVDALLTDDSLTRAITGGWQSFLVECHHAVVRVTVDGTDVLHAKGLVQNVGQVGFFVSSGQIAIRNLQLNEYPLPVRELPLGVYRPALDGKGPVRLPSVRKEVRPRYTRAALINFYQGEVLLECVVEPDGRVGAVDVVRSLHPELDQEAIRAAKQWKFSPGLLEGKPVPVLVTISMGFTLW